MNARPAIHQSVNRPTSAVVLRRARGATLSFLAAVLLALSPPLHAHDPGLSTLQIQLCPDRTEATLTFAIRDAGTLIQSFSGLGTSTTAGGREALEASLAKLADTALQLKFDASRPAPGEATVTLDDANNASLHFTIPQVPTGQLTIRSSWLARLPGGHRQFLTVQSTAGLPLAERLLSAREDTLVIEIPATATPPSATTTTGSFVEFLGLGMKHILIGYDHLLFLFSLLLVSRGTLATFKVITTFTIAHSITLALATFDVVTLPASVVEPLIAASIVYVAAENFIRRTMPASRLWLVFTFGLIHGLGFASVLRDLGIASGAGGIALPLFSFNLGVELGQLLVALPLLPLIHRANAAPSFERRWMPACSIAAALAGAFWLVERIL